MKVTVNCTHKLWSARDLSPLSACSTCRTHEGRQVGSRESGDKSRALQSDCDLFLSLLEPCLFLLAFQDRICLSLSKRGDYEKSFP